MYIYRQNAFEWFVLEEQWERKAYQIYMYMLSCFLILFKLIIKQTSQNKYVDVMGENNKLR